MILYAATVTLGACLLFLVQPLIAKIILPWFGGASAVWTAALVFFQLCVLSGYAYAHLLTTHLSPRAQRILHCLFLAACCALLPILPSDTWRPTSAGDPTLRILLLLTATVGLPALLLSCTSPLLQVWAARRDARDFPYWLFALSNLGSMVALLSFPLLLEPSFSSRTMAIAWSVAFFCFVALTIGVAWLGRDSVDAQPPVNTEGRGAPPRATQMVLWVLFAACGSALLVSISAHLSTNVAPIPLLWVVPLAIYLLTFILCFGHERLYNRKAFFPVLAAALGSMAYLYVHGDANLHLRLTIPLFLIGLFVACFACHGELVRRRPSAAYSTRFYLLIALGGALGGLFVAVVAPKVFDTYLELPLLLIVVAGTGVALQWRRKGSRHTLWPVRFAMVAGLVALVGYLALAERAMRAEHLVVHRNFYGVLRVRDELIGDEWARRNLIHGTISHGYQSLSEAYRNVPGAYFSATSGVGRALEALESDGPIRYGVIGLGAGILASYARQGDYLRIYEVNPAVLEIANEHFTFLPRARATGVNLEVILGDARLSLEGQDNQRFDLLAVDAFSSDAIPTHLLTNEAVAMYFGHLKPEGVLAVHISNRYLDLVPVCQRAAEHVGRSATVLRSGSDGMSYASVWVLITSNQALLEHPELQSADKQSAKADASFAGWSDDYSSLWPLLNLRSR
jgi:hypothetical protein